MRRDFFAAQPVLTARRQVQTAEQIHESRFARTRRTHHRHEFTLRDRRRHTAQRADCVRIHAIDLLEIPHEDQRLHAYAPNLGLFLGGSEVRDLPSGAIPMITSEPSCRSPDTTSECEPSVRPTRTATCFGVSPSALTIQTRPALTAPPRFRPPLLIVS